MRKLVFCVCMLFSVVAFAKPAGKAQQAKELFENGKKAYNVGDFAQAITHWKKGYELVGDGLFLFNMAQAHRQLKQYEQALFLYKAYLREVPNAENKDSVDQRIQELETLLSKAQQPPNEAITPPSTGGDPTGEEPPVEEEPEEATEPVPTTPPPAVDHGHRGGGGKKLWGIIIGAAGIVMIGTGIGFTMAASSKADDLEKRAKAGEEWNDDRQATLDDMNSQSTMGAVFIGAGAVALTGGAVLYFLGRREASRSTTVAVAPGNVRLAWAVTF